MKTRRVVMLAVALMVSRGACVDLSRIGVSYGEPTGRLSASDEITWARQSEQRFVFKASSIGRPGARENAPRFAELCQLLARTHELRVGRLVPLGDHKRVALSGKVNQRQSDTVFLLADPDCLLITAAPRGWVDGDEIGGIDARYEGVFSYTTVMGAQRSVRRYREAGPAILDPGEVMLALHSGDVVEVIERARRRCPICVGKGKIRGDGRRGEDEAKLKTCPLGADGDAPFTTVFTLRW